MRRTSITAAIAAVSLATAALAGCGGGSATGNGGNKNPKTLTYWASNQGKSLDDDKQKLTPELQKFEKQTGIHVKLEVVGWPDLLNRVLTAASSGQGPDVLNIGNTWSASLQATGALLPFDDKAFTAIGGKDRFVASALGSTGAAGKAPAAVPLYSLAYGLYYNKKLFKAAGITNPPATWADLVADGKKLTGGGKYGLAVEGANNAENIHHAYIFAKQHGGDFFDASGNPTFTSPGAVAGVKQYVDFIASDKITAPGDAEYAQNQSLQDFATGKAGMLLWQAAGVQLAQRGMKAEDWGVAPVPVQSGAPGQGTNVDTMVAGINMAVFKNSQNQDGALKFVKFMTSDEEQKILNGKYGSIPPVSAAQSDPQFSNPEQAVLREGLAKSAVALPQVPKESQFEDLVGTALKDLFADAAAGKAITTETVQKRLEKAQQQMTG
ncbi:sugar ABC transporter substrate-binding protein [Actinomadura sp. DC4]|uniref:ABC transporter substrate-binding protein n=1 Tax=Actinomadura sp. DC4 TaxID=3055069 RepID=UPI0025B08CD1|nr:sugar ABC transporter substrate-binding protein [Actinomadura sp. DC4]MDN3358784.1 sugar ABC transporter substrate-binding protein [Actinomadura sp. DC4]